MWKKIDSIWVGARYSQKNNRLQKYVCSGKRASLYVIDRLFSYQPPLARQHLQYSIVVAVCLASHIGDTVLLLLVVYLGSLVPFLFL